MFGGWIDYCRAGVSYIPFWWASRIQSQQVWGVPVIGSPYNYMGGWPLFNLFTGEFPGRMHS
jgi:hypothetical protein